MPHPVFTDDYIRKMCPENHPFSLKELSMYRDTKTPKYLEKKPGIKYVPMPVRPPVTKSALARRMVPLGNKEQLLSANKAIEKLLKEGGSAEEEKVELEDYQGAEGGVADALDQEEIDDVADMSPEDIEELAETQGLDDNEVEELQAQVQGVRRSSRLASRPSTPEAAGSSMQPFTPTAKRYLERERRLREEQKTP